jgi:tetratricopeptide (TPR) repeat protein
LPIGTFIIEIDPQSKSKLREIYFEDETETIKVDDNIILQLRMGLSEKRLFNLTRPDYPIVSYIDTFKRGKDQYSLILGVILKSSDDPNNFRESIKMVSANFIKDIDAPAEKIKEDLKNAYEEYFETPSIILNQKELEARLKDKVKQLNKEMKFEEAKKMLEIISKVPKKLYEANKSAEKAIKTQDYDKAEREFNRAIKLAEELKENDVVNGLKEKSKIVKEIPEFIEKRNKAVDKAKDSLKYDNFEDAYKYFRDASELSKKLLDSRGVEEYSLKADALAKYNEVHKRFHK